jgi:hypothetical protein
VFFLVPYYAFFTKAWQGTTMWSEHTQDSNAVLNAKSKGL